MISTLRCVFRLNFHSTEHIMMRNKSPLSIYHTHIHTFTVPTAQKPATHKATNRIIIIIINNDNHVANHRQIAYRFSFFFVLVVLCPSATQRSTNRAQGPAAYQSHQKTGSSHARAQCPNGHHHQGAENPSDGHGTGTGRHPSGPAGFCFAAHGEHARARAHY